MSHPGYMQLISISSTTPGYKFWCHDMTLPICQWWLGLHVSLVCTICYIYVEVRIIFSALEC